MIEKIQNIKKKSTSYNLTSRSEINCFYPRNYNDIKKILFFLKKNNQKVLIKTGGCSYGDKANLKDSDYTISLQKISSIISFDKKKKIINAQAGIQLEKLLDFLEEKGYGIFNVPGGKKVSLGGAISGNVHGRPATKTYSTFGDNVISLKVMMENGTKKVLRNGNKSFNEIVGGLGLFGIILEAKIKVFKINSYYYKEKASLIKSEKQFLEYQKDISYCVGVCNYFNQSNFEGKFYKFIPQKNIDNEKVVTTSKYNFFDFINYLKIPFLMSLTVNFFTLQIFYFLLFNIKIFNTGNKLLNFKKSVYLSDINQTLPNYYRGGLIEIQFGFKKRKLFHLIKKLKKMISFYKVFPIYFIIKKMHKSKKKYIFNFPKNRFNITLTFTKKCYEENRYFFAMLYKILKENKCNLYMTKDETFIQNADPKIVKKYFNLSLFKKNKILSSDFKEKIMGNYFTGN